MKELNDFLKGYIVGLTDGEGSFNIAIQKTNSVRLGYFPHPRFQIDMNKKETKIMDFLIETFPFGKIFFKNNESERRRGKRSDDIIRFYVWGITECQQIIDFFDQHKLICKAKDFELWKKCIEIMKRGKHLEKEGFLEICKLRDEMNKKMSKKVKTYRSYSYFKNLFDSKTDPRENIKVS